MMFFILCGLVLLVIIYLGMHWSYARGFDAGIRYARDEWAETKVVEKQVNKFEGKKIW